MTHHDAEKTVTHHRAKLWLTSDLAVEFSVFDHHASQVPDAAWETFAAGYRHAHGTEPAATLTGYVVDRSTWTWDTTYSDGTVVIGDPDGPLALEDEPAGPEGCRIVFWDEGNVHDTGLRVWAGETAIIRRLLREREAREG